MPGLLHPSSDLPAVHLPIQKLLNITPKRSSALNSPVISDSANWAPRIEQGLETMRTHAVEGYTGSAGYMPPKGARLDLSDQEVYDAVDYMLSEIP